MTNTVTDEQLEAMWQRAGQAKDYSMCEFIERAIDGDDFYRRQCEASSRSVAIYAEAIGERICHHQDCGNHYAPGHCHERSKP